MQYNAVRIGSSLRRRSGDGAEAHHPGRHDDRHRRLVARRSQIGLRPTASTVEIVPMDGLDAARLRRGRRFTSSAPRPMARATCPTTRRRFTPRSSATSPDLGHVRYGVIALGDRTYAADVLLRRQALRRAAARRSARSASAKSMHPRRQRRHDARRDRGRLGGGMDRAVACARGA